MDGEAVGARKGPSLDDQAVADARADGDVGEEAPAPARPEPAFGPRCGPHIRFDGCRGERGKALAHRKIGPVKVVGAADAAGSVDQLGHADADPDHVPAACLDQAPRQRQRVREHGVAATRRIGRNGFAMDDSAGRGIDDAGRDLGSADVDAEDDRAAARHQPADALSR
jgi:hypothetical protein